MAKTSLTFYRKNQSLHDMSMERPKHMPALRDAIIAATSEIEAELRKLERDFNEGQRHEDAIRQVLSSVKYVMNTFDLPHINSAEDLHDVIEMTLEPSEVFRYDMLAASRVKEYHRKLMEFLPSGFEVIINDLRRIMTYLQTYCVSFCPSNIIAEAKTKRKNAYLETAVHYALKRKDMAKTIEMHIQNIELMASSYRTKEGVSSKVFGLSTNEIARRCDCGDIPFLLIFPEACFNVHFACAGIRKWIEADRDYNEFLRNDIAKLDERKVEHSKVIQDNRSKLGGLEHAIKSTRKVIEQLEIEMNNAAKSEEKVLAALETLRNDVKVMELELDYQEGQRRELKESAKDSSINETELVRRLDEIGKVVAKIRIDMPETRLKIEAVKSKERNLIERRERLSNKLDELQNLEKQKLMARGAMHVAKLEQEKINTALAVLKDIYLRKTSADMTKKIFNKMPVHPRHPPPAAKNRDLPAVIQSKDPLGQASLFVAKRIEGDWPQLYRSLPFYPPRGAERQDQDIDQTIQKLYRVDDKQKAKETLEKWKTHNTLANVESLKDTLRHMGKREIVDEMERRRSKAAAHGMSKVNSKQHWKKLKKFKATFGKIMALQAQTHRSKADTTAARVSRPMPLNHKALFEVAGDMKHIKTGRINLKNSNIILPKTTKKKAPLPAINTPRIKVH